MSDWIDGAQELISCDLCLSIEAGGYFHSPACIAKLGASARLKV